MEGKQSYSIILTLSSTFLIFFVVGDVENDKLSAHMVLVFSPKTSLVSYKICVATVEKKLLCPHLVDIQICEPIK
jgi:hypothetical protein